MDQELKKVAADVPGVLLASAQHMRKLAGDNTALLNRASAAEHELSCMKLARRMEQRNLEQGLDFEQKVAQLLKLPVAKIASMEQAVELAAGGFQLGKVAESEASTAIPASAESLDQFIHSGAAYGA